MSLQAVELHTAQEVRDHALSVSRRILAGYSKPPAILAIQSELEAVKADRDHYRALVVELEAEKLTLLSRLDRFTRRLTASQIGAVTQEDSTPVSPPTKVTLERIITESCNYFRKTRNDLLSQRRSRDVVRPRQIAMFLAKELTLHSLPRIGDVFGGRDHTTVLHAHRRISVLKELDPDTGQDIQAITHRLVSGP